jgi:hypothetical protein
VSNPFELNHPLYTDYNPGDLSGVPSSPRTCITDPPSGLTALATATFWETYNPAIHCSPGCYNNLVLANPTTAVLNLTAPRCSITPELQYHEEEIPQANVSNGLQLFFNNNKNPAALSPLLALTYAASELPHVTGPAPIPNYVDTPFNLIFPDPMDIPTTGTPEVHREDPQNIGEEEIVSETVTAGSEATVNSSDWDVEVCWGSLCACRRSSLADTSQQLEAS